MLTARVLRAFCYSTRPEWDNFGRLCRDGRGVPPKFLTLPDRFGAEIWDTLNGARVLDYGCGYGADVIDCLHHGINASGFDVRDFVLAAARRQAEGAGVTGPFYRPDESHGLRGAFDYILSVNCFEHYLNPAAVLRHMRWLLKPTGVVLAYFSPPWLHPYGGHVREMTPLPWVHLLFPERAVMRLRTEYYAENATCYEDAAGGLNRMTVAKFKHVIAGSPFGFRRLELLPIRGIRAVTKIAGLRELLTTAVRAELIPNDL